MITSEKYLTIVVSFLVLGSLILAIKNNQLSSKFIDLASTGLGGYLALSIQKTKPVNSIS